MDYNADLLQNYAENKGYFKTLTSADSTSHNRRAEAHYTVNTGKQYKIRNVTFPIDSANVALDSTIARIKRRSLLKPGQPYDLDVIKSERERIDQRLKNKGYFYFNPDYILVRVDSTVGDHQVDLKVIVKDETPQKAKEVYTINNIYIFPDYSLENRNDTITYAGASAIKHDDFTIIDPDINSGL